MKLLISSILFSFIFFTPSLQFSDYLKFFIEGNKKIPKEYREKFLEIGLNCVRDHCPDFIAKKILFERPDKTMMVYERTCGAGGLCKVQNIIVYDKNEKLVGHYPYYIEIADCSFHEIKETTFVTDTLLFIRTIKQEVDCDSDAITKKGISLTKVDMADTPFNETLYNVDEEEGTG